MPDLWMDQAVGTRASLAPRNVPRRGCGPLCSWFHALVGLAICVVGCTAHPRPVGDLLATERGGDLAVLELEGLKARSLTSWEIAGSGSLGFGGRIGDSLIISTIALGPRIESWIWYVDAQGRGNRAIGRGLYPTVLSPATLGFVCYGDSLGVSARVPVVHMQPHQVGIEVDTLGWARVAKAGPNWWSSLTAPVSIGGSVVVVVGPDGALWRVDASLGQWSRLGHAGLLPLMWQERPARLLCQDQSFHTWWIDVWRPEVKAMRVRALDEMIAFVPWNDAECVLFVQAGIPWALVERYDLCGFDWKSGATWCIGDVTHLSGRMIWEAPAE